MHPTIVGSTLALILWLFFVLLIARLVIDYIQMFARSWRPTGVLLVAAEVIYTITDPPLKALRRLIPPLVGLIVGIILNTTLIQVIGGSELLETAEQSIERLGSPPPVGLLDPHAFEILGAVAVVFFLICFPLTRLAAYLERRLVA